MSNSRLEKFIYAICGMDVDDLPTPLSRIETLWNCLITGEVPDFEPLSRNEKYLMSMLTGDVNALPEPTSRSEKLLYKIATGETDLTDVPGYLSRYEELLKQLIENGGIGGTDFEYVLYTLNQPLSTLYTTAEGPVKSAILSGQTLVNLLSTSTIKHEEKGTVNINYKIFPDKTKKKMLKIKFRTLPTLIDGANRFLKLEIYSNSVVKGYLEIPTSYMKLDVDYTFVIDIFDNDVNKTYLTSWIPQFSTGILEYDVLLCDYQEGMENWDIPYFEGMQSVKMPVLTTCGKNLFDMKQLIEPSKWTGIWSEKLNLTDFKLKRGGTYYFDVPYRIRWMKDKTTVLEKQFGAKKSFTIPLDYDEVVYDIYIPDMPLEDYKNAISSSYITYGTSPTTYEPYKSNILSCNEEVELRGIGDVKDTLDGNTGELTQRIWEIVLDGSENWSVWYHTDNILRFFCSVSDMDNSSSLILQSDALPSYGYNLNKEGIFGYSRKISLVIDNSDNKLNGNTVSDLKDFLSQNPITVQYKLATSIVKTVVLSITDQDGQATKLSTFNDITHVSIESDGLIPTVDLEVPTKIEETLSSLPTLMNDISETQQSLNESIDDQVENINEVSTAITEIRSDIL